ncbi:MAG: hypothetical protein ACTHJ3_01115, partial [Pararhizobium sp.]
APAAPRSRPYPPSIPSLLPHTHRTRLAVRIFALIPTFTAACPQPTSAIPQDYAQKRPDCLVLAQPSHNIAIRTPRRRKGRRMPTDIMAGYGTKLSIAVVVVAAALFALFLVARAMRNRGTSAFLRGGSNRQPRLAVLDAAAVDAHRRLVLVRRDDVEHLILIGGPTDIVVESGIGLAKAGAAETPRVELGAVAPEPPLRNAEPHRPAAKPAREAVAAESAAAAVAPARAAALSDPAVPPRPAPAESAAARRPPAQELRAPVAPPDLRAAPTAAPAPLEPVRTETVVAPFSTAGPEERTRRDAEDVLDGARGRVFGPSEMPRRLESGGFAEGPTACFDEFLDAQVTGDLSAVTPDTARDEPLAKPAADPDHRVESPGDPVLDDEMARLLGDLSARR